MALYFSIQEVLRKDKLFCKKDTKKNEIKKNPVLN